MFDILSLSQLSRGVFPHLLLVPDHVGDSEPGPGGGDGPEGGVVEAADVVGVDGVDFRAGGRRLFLSHNQPFNTRMIVIVIVIVVVIVIVTPALKNKTLHTIVYTLSAFSDVLFGADPKMGAPTSCIE